MLKIKMALQSVPGGLILAAGTLTNGGWLVMIWLIMIVYIIMAIMV